MNIRVCSWMNFNQLCSIFIISIARIQKHFYSHRAQHFLLQLFAKYYHFHKWIKWKGASDWETPLNSSDFGCFFFFIRCLCVPYIVERAFIHLLIHKMAIVGQRTRHPYIIYIQYTCSSLCRLFPFAFLTTFAMNTNSWRHTHTCIAEANRLT